MEFILNTSSLEGLGINGSAVCNNYAGQYNLLSPTSLELSGYIFTSNTCNTIEEDNFETLYSNFLDFTTGLNTYSYEITGTGNNAILKLTKNNSDELLFSRQALSITQHESKTSFKIFPNPVKDNLLINNNKPVNFSIYSITGKLLMQGNILKNANISIVDLENGVYFLNINTGLKKETKKFIKQ